MSLGIRNNKGNGLKHNDSQHFREPPVVIGETQSLLISVHKHVEALNMSTSNGPILQTAVSNILALVSSLTELNSVMNDSPKIEHKCLQDSITYVGTRAK